VKTPQTVAPRLPDASRIVPKKLAHIVLKTNRFETMIDWYATVLNARIVLKKPHVAFLTYDDEHHRLAISNIPQLANRPRDICGLDHVAFTYNDLGDLLATYRRLASRGIKPRWPFHHGNTISFYYEDPDGNRVELQKDIFESAEAAEHYAETDREYAENPLGAPFDPEEMIKQYERGASFETLIKMPSYAAGLGPVKMLEEMGYILGPPPG
jgi:catechol 2,3-dioxygenase-like lactoylglutathione lyase family enzyme